jgi:gas vesicle protein
MMNENNPEKVVWFVAGVAIGAGLALLFAPGSGRETRSVIAEKAGEGVDALAERGKDILDRGKEVYERGRKIADEAADLFERSKKLVRS